MGESLNMNEKYKHSWAYQVSRKTRKKKKLYCSWLVPEPKTKILSKLNPHFYGCLLKLLLYSYILLQLYISDSVCPKWRIACIFIGLETFCIPKQFASFGLSGRRHLADFRIFLKTNNMFHLIRGCRRLVCLRNQSLCGRSLLFYLAFIAQAWAFVFWKPINVSPLVIRKNSWIISVFMWRNT